MWKKQSNFSVTCSLLSQYLKEKGGLGSLGLESMGASRPLDHQQVIIQAGVLNRKPTTMDLLPGLNASHIDEIEVDMNINQITAQKKSMDLFPQDAGFDEDQSNSEASSIKKAPLTIFYGGKLLVFEDFPAEKAKDLMQMAGKEAAAVETAQSSLSTAESGNQLAAKNCLLVMSGNRATASDLPIARRNSLHRFLEKRKDRITARAPYQVGGGRGSAAAVETGKTVQKDTKSWLGLGREVFNPEESHESRRRQR